MILGHLHRFHFVLEYLLICVFYLEHSNSVGASCVCCYDHASVHCAILCSSHNSIQYLKGLLKAQQKHCDCLSQKLNLNFSTAELTKKNNNFLTMQMGWDIDNVRQTLL